MTCTETTCRDQEGNVTAFRPESVVGSYAVYHNTKSNYDITGKDYRAGKVLHIYRPKVIDRNGEETWGVLSVDSERQLLTVTVDDAWLDHAVYPVIVDPVFGYSGKGSTSTYNEAQTSLTASKFSLGEQATLESINIYAYSSSGTQALKAMIYGDDNGNPSTPEGQSLQRASNSTGALASSPADWYNASLTSSITLAADDYWLTWVLSASTGGIYYDTGSSNQSYRSYQFGTDKFTTPPNPWPTDHTDTQSNKK